MLNRKLSAHRPRPLRQADGDASESRLEESASSTATSASPGIGTVAWQLDPRRSSGGSEHLLEGAPGIFVISLNEEGDWVWEYVARNAKCLARSAAAYRTPRACVSSVKTLVGAMGCARIWNAEDEIWQI